MSKKTREIETVWDRAKEFTGIFLWGLRELIDSAGMSLREVAELWEVSPGEALKILKGESPMPLVYASRVWLAVRGRELRLEENSPGSMVALAFEVLSAIREKEAEKR